jgi:phosphoadenosine phosphosulfate reductase
MNMILSPKILNQVSSIKTKINCFKEQKLKLIVSSSFQTHSIPLLHILATIDPYINVYFLDTGFHFPETLAFKEAVKDLLGITVFNLESNTPKLNQRDSNGRFLFCSDPDYCCNINKVIPLEPILMTSDVWITGVRRDQSSTRLNFKHEMDGPFNSIRYHPMLDWTMDMILDYRAMYNLPEHPLEKKGYLSVGCEPCTQKVITGERDAGRWNGQSKTECGLHTKLIKE